MSNIKEVVGYAANIIFSNEGTYGSVNKNDNGAVSVGKVQWHGNRALGLLKTICAVGAVQAKIILGDNLHNEIINAPSNAWTKRIVTASEAAVISALLISVPGKQAQDDLAEVDITTYVNKGISYGLTDCGALIYFSDGVNQYGTASTLWRDITQKALAGRGDVEAMFVATKAMTTNYLARREKVYKAVKALNLSDNTHNTVSESVYTVKAGDTLWGIAVKYLGSGTRYKEIKTLNGLQTDLIRPGQILEIPEK